MRVREPRQLIIGLIFLAAAGFGIATYLTVKHYQGDVPVCSITGGCHNVLTSKYASVGPVATAALGMVYYLAVAVSGFLYLRSGNLLVMKLLTLLTAVGFLVSLYLIYLQLWVIGAICPYCMSSALICVLMLAVDLMIWKKYLAVSSGQASTEVGV